ncbi:hypothetical protein N5923_18535 [Erwiniaceae bacterium BAC15a-03b]|uniref:Uncharacterized protein n=1 Tax=Winslowiella arboricola TaxID=2978220 RepID=A0A9J6PXA8_9GAMM|nr:hypothetical protein [Winslowiella arboricola]MCU5779484.1 hypothetical protein [Winslowiella arboricola]
MAVAMISASGPNVFWLSLPIHRTQAMPGAVFTPCMFRVSCRFPPDNHDGFVKSATEIKSFFIKITQGFYLIFPERLIRNTTMQILNFSRAVLFNSSRAAYKLVLENPEYSSYATLIIQAKNLKTQYELNFTHLSVKKRASLINKIPGYTKYLKNIEFLNFQRN